jgi:hypothetical protein
LLGSNPHWPQVNQFRPWMNLSSASKQQRRVYNMARPLNPNEELIKSLLPPSGVSPAGDLAQMAVPPISPAPVPQMQGMQGPATPPPAQSPAPGIGQKIGNFVQGIGDTPEERQALIRFATSMMQPVDPRTQTVAGRFGEALQGSVDYLAQLRERERMAKAQAEQAQYERGQAEKEFKLKEREVGAKEKGVSIEEKKLGPEAGLKGAQAEKARAEAWYLRNMKKEPGTEAGAKQSYAEKFAASLYKIDQMKPQAERKYQVQDQAIADAVQFLETAGKKSPAAAVADFYTTVAPAYSLVAGSNRKEDLKEKDVYDELAAMIRKEASEVAPYQQTVLPTQPQAPAQAPAAAEHPRPTSQAEYDALPSGTVYVDPGDGKLYRKP